LDLSDRMVELNPGYDERGLLGLAFHPDYANNGRFFVYYSAPLREGAPADWNHTSHVSEFAVSQDNPDLADADSERIVMQIDQPQGNHNGGQIAFGPDGYLYIPLGDGGSANDVAVGHTPDLGNGQDTSNLLGSILRIDVDEGDPYGIPADNPFDGEQGLEEIFAYGFRNPYRISFDAGGDNQLYVGDAGQNQWEEVSVVTLGGNYGWNIKEGTHCFDPDRPDAQVEECPDTGRLGEPLIDPVIEYQNVNVEGGLGLVVVGGNVYRGSALPELEGRYIFGDWSSSWEAPEGSLMVVTPSETEGELWEFEELSIASRENGELGAYLLSFGQDADLELYVMTSGSAGPSGNDGQIYKIVPAAQDADQTPTTVADETATAAADETPTAVADETPTAAADETPTAAVDATPTAGADGDADEEQPGELPETGGTSTPWTPILLVAGGILALMAAAFVLLNRRIRDTGSDR
ncbi:MAG TPA: PQQ-dependent sugar dehydrogenase, partial [Anaerolineae bacterium]|nr:PQQ-dependent sugar dehydrogenase [Anaerolineae bacterium]